MTILEIIQILMEKIIFYFVKILIYQGFVILASLINLVQELIYQPWIGFMSRFLHVLLSKGIYL